MHHKLLILALVVGCGPLAVLLLVLATLTAAARLVCAIWRTARRIRARTRCPSRRDTPRPHTRHVAHRALVSAAHAAGNATPHGSETPMSHQHRFREIHIEIQQHWRCGSDTRELERLIRTLQAETTTEQHEITGLQALIAELLRRTPDLTPAHVHVTVKGNPMSFAPGATITFTAASANNTGLTVPDTYTWTTTAGTIVPGADTTVITISDAPLGDVTATATDPLGLAGSGTATVAEVVDETPASVTVTVS